MPAVWAKRLIVSAYRSGANETEKWGKVIKFAGIKTSQHVRFTPKATIGYENTVRRYGFILLQEPFEAAVNFISAGSRHVPALCLWAGS